ncbi:MAG: hypothetical protein RMH97_08105 [Verrucomicrobiales bacterium]|nr:hypothetical protein [Verrucomicrobiales bacterium]
MSVVVTRNVGLILLAISGLALTAQEEVVISKEAWHLNELPIPIAVVGFSGEVERVLKFDLEVVGCKLVSPSEAQYLVSGSNSERVEGRLTDQISKTVLLAKAYTGGTLRAQAHAFADDIVALLPNRGRGIARTRIAFRVAQGQVSEIYVADYDGFNAQPVTQDGTITAAPAWVPGRLELYYTSYKLGGPHIFRHDLSTGTRKVFARYPGLNTSAAVSPDGRRVAMILSKSGSPDLYVCNADGSDLKQLTFTREDESSPCWSPDGRWICFAAKPKERRVLCKVRADGGPVEIIRTGGVPNPTEPDWSPDGRWIAFTSQTRAGFDICVVPAEGGTATVLVAGEDPSWAPNSRTLIFTRRVQGGTVLSLLDVPTRQVKDVARVSGNCSQPSWAR